MKCVHHNRRPMEHSRKAGTSPLLLVEVTSGQKKSELTGSSLERRETDFQLALCRGGFLDAGLADLDGDRGLAGTVAQVVKTRLHVL